MQQVYQQTRNRILSIYDNTVSILPFKFHIYNEKDIVVDVSIVDKDARGEYFTVMFPGKTIKIYLGKTTFEFPTVNLGDLSITTVSPESLIAITKAFQLTGETRIRQEDNEYMIRLAKKFGIKDLDKIIPEIREYGHELDADLSTRRV